MSMPAPEAADTWIRGGPATVSTRIRLAGSQRIVALAHCADDSWWYDQAEVSVAEGACYEGE
jgi:sulfur-oxidizing protein SoxY